ncbi:RNA helicase [Pontibacter sp. JH31]|uniref:RNA helicase n=1 Tax=Pontibacter aquaedesilientis TaxID=2766980 RepID=A0ABR7XIP8_9BACT|nr:RNA helicase [Pontibacter aquaedesilientis]MBD1398139.1 RNA helicase [Pontibacter aquaedesilientis]
MPNKQKPTETEQPIENKEICGLIMPIAGNDEYTAAHWSEVKHILEEVIQEAGFIANMVSDAEEIGIIHNRIVTNIYNNPIVVCDVSSKNPNVMFELGLRLAFDKATIIVKDDATNYTFDTGVIEHLSYPRDLRYSSIIGFKQKLKAKLISTYEKSKDPEYSTFLKSFVQYKPKLETQEIGPQEFLMKQLENINKQLARLEIKNTGVHVINKLKQSGASDTGITLSSDFLKSEFVKSLNQNNNSSVIDFSNISAITSHFIKYLEDKGVVSDFSVNDKDKLIYQIHNMIYDSWPNIKSQHIA